MNTDTRNKELTCSDCGETFTFTTREQEFFREKGFSEPKRCKNCRDRRKATKRGGAQRSGY